MNLVELQISPIFSNFRSRVMELRDEISADGSKILRREEEASIRRLWYRTGATLQSLQDETVTEGNARIYRLMPTAVSKRGAPYPLFGEYGTGRLGAGSGRPAPRGYRYGDRAGMAARRYSRIAVATARPQIDNLARERVRRFAANATVN